MSDTIKKPKMRVFEIEGRQWYAARSMREALETAASLQGIHVARIEQYTLREVRAEELDIPIVPGDRNRRMGSLSTYLGEIDSPCLLFSPWERHDAREQGHEGCADRR